MALSRTIKEKVLSLIKDSCNNECGRQLKCLQENCALYRIKQYVLTLDKDIEFEEKLLTTLDEIQSAARVAKGQETAHEASVSMYAALRAKGQKNGK